MIKLPQVTLICLTNKDFEGHKQAIDKSCEGIEFGAVKLIWDEQCTSIDIWNYKIIYELPGYIDTDFALLIHADGYVTMPHLWQESWLSYDFIGAPWPLPRDGYSYRDAAANIVRVGNSVSLRSKKLLDLMAQTPEEYFWSFKEKYGNTNEDGYICCHNRVWLEGHGCKFAPLEVAVHFSKEHEILENKNIDTFAFHSL
jgi:hypothetical protein